MLTSDDKKRRVQWAKQHKNDNFTRTIFADEASFQLFRNAIRRWTKHPNTEFKRIPKNRQKVHRVQADSSGFMDSAVFPLAIPKPKQYYSQPGGSIPKTEQ
ncbi:unnamed protein product [Rotaria sp. Silwood1]|nr:unnamed protein product [Rotaria sp. Silwood1]